MSSPFAIFRRSRHWQSHEHSLPALPYVIQKINHNDYKPLRSGNVSFYSSMLDGFILQNAATYTYKVPFNEFIHETHDCFQVWAAPGKVSGFGSSTRDDEAGKGGRGSNVQKHLGRDATGRQRAHQTCQELVLVLHITAIEEFRNSLPISFAIRHEPHSLIQGQNYSSCSLVFPSSEVLL